jgi:hypothetical protein
MQSTIDKCRTLLKKLSDIYEESLHLEEGALIATRP